MRIKTLVNLLMLSSASFIYADNTALFNQAKSIGQQHQFNLNLNANSNISSYSNASGFESTIASNANAGNENAQNMYGRANLDPNYLFNSGTQDIKNCEGRNDPRCSTINKYLDKGTQTTLQAYSQGVSERFYIAIKPDPSSSSCSYVTRKVPINPVQVTCTTSAHMQNSCNATISISVAAYDCDPTSGGCSSYQSNPQCQLIRPYIAPTCTAYSYKANYGGCSVGSFKCIVPSTFRTPGCNDSGGRSYSCGSCSSGGDPADHNACWSQQCISWTQAQLAAYSCKTYQYSDGCSGLKQ